MSTVTEPDPGRLRCGYDNRRRGAVYVIVLGVAMIISMIALASLHVSRVDLRSATAAQRLATARVAAMAAVELGLARLQADANWRSNYSSGQEVPSATWTTLGGSKLKFQLIDDDGNLSDDVSDPVTLKGIGSSADAVAVASVQVEPSGTGLSCLNNALHSHGNLFISSNVTNNQSLSSNSSITVAAGRTVTGDAWAVGLISGTVQGVKYPLSSPALTMPDPMRVFDYYLANGTVININSIPSKKIEKQVLAADRNPYGAENPQGIYIINCGSDKLVISNSRIQATLVILNFGNQVELEGDIFWQPPSPNYPAMMTTGSVEMRWHGHHPLSESAESTNYNPSGAPYQGVTDSDQTDTYPGLIKGLVYISGNLSITDQASLHGAVVVRGTTSIGADTSLTFDNRFRDYAPPGFSAGNEVRIVPGSWRRVAR